MQEHLESETSKLLALFSAQMKLSTLKKMDVLMEPKHHKDRLEKIKQANALIGSKY